jgi:aryl-alcohol dehydrogenase-like predicted oxidoreductase
MARELGLGVTPWSPLKSGVLSGKYSRANAGKVETKRAWVTGLDEKVYALLDELTVVAKELDSTPARTALAWVQGRPGVTSTIIGARTLQQLDQNLGALEVKLSSAQVARLDALSAPQLNFPGEFLKTTVPALMHGGLSVNGEAPDSSPFAPAPGAKTY